MTTSIKGKIPLIVSCANSLFDLEGSQSHNLFLKFKSIDTVIPLDLAFCAAIKVASAAFSDSAGVIPLRCSQLAPLNIDSQSYLSAGVMAMDEFWRSYMTLLGR